MRRKRGIFFVLCAILAGAVGIVVFTKKTPRKPKVQMIYLETLPTNVNDSIPKAVFKVVNFGSEPAHIRMANVARKDGDQWRYDLQSMALLEPSCTVGPRTNCTIFFHFPFNSRPGIWRVEAVVFEPCTKIQTAVFAARRLWARISGKGKYNQFWLPGGFTRAYEINSTDVPGLALGRPRTYRGPLARVGETISKEVFPVDFGINFGVSDSLQSAITTNAPP